MKRLYVGVAVVAIGNDSSISSIAGCFSDDDAAMGRLVKRAMEEAPGGRLASARVFPVMDDLVREAMGYITEAAA